MALYRMYFFDFGGHVRVAYHVERDDDAAAIEAAHRLNVLPRKDAGFEVWEGDRLVHRYQN